MALTAACVLAHAAVLDGLPRQRVNPGQGAGQDSVMRLTNVSVAMPVAPPRNADLPRHNALDEVASAAPKRRASADGAEPARTTRVAPADVPAAAPAAAPAEPAQEAPPSPSAAIEHLPTSALDVPPMPRSAPDEQYVEHVHHSGLPIQVRLYIDASGGVTEASLLGAAPGDEEAAEQVMAMFRGTAFSPGRLQGREVASFIDIELVLEPTLPPLGRVFRQ